MLNHTYVVNWKFLPAEVSYIRGRIADRYIGMQLNIKLILGSQMTASTSVPLADRPFEVGRGCQKHVDQDSKCTKYK